MGGLTTSLITGMQALDASEAALDSASNNIANANTPGYTREVAEFSENAENLSGGTVTGGGVTLEGIQSVRDELLNLQIQQQTSLQSSADTQSSGLQQIQTYFASTGEDIASTLSAFSSSLAQLSANPSSSAVQQSVLSAGQNLAESFNTTASGLSTAQTTADQQVTQTVAQINTLSQQIAQLNGQISNLQNVGESAGSFIDQRTQAIDQLSSLVDVSVIPSNNSLTLTTGNGTPLVAGQQSFQLTTAVTPSGMHDVYSQGTDITNSIVSGQLGGTLQARDQQIPAIQNQLDTLAAGLANAVNTVQAGGFDLNGNAGTDLFIPPPAAVTGAAASLSVAITNPALIAASSDGTVGSNGNAEAMYALGSQAVIDGQDPTDYYSDIVFNVGNATSNATAEQTASNLVLQQLNDQNSSISGVSLDEEAANLVQYQNAYSASAQVVTTINDMMYAVVNMATLTG